VRRLRVSGQWAASSDVWMLGLSAERPWRLAVLLGIYLGPWCWSLAIEWLTPQPHAVPSSTPPEELLAKALEN